MDFLSPGSRARKRTAPGGANTSVQFNKSGFFGGDAGFTYAGGGSVSIAQGTLTSDIRALSVTGAWNNGGLNFIPFQMNYTNTNSNSPIMMDLQLAGVSFFQVVPPVGFQNAGINFIQQNAGGVFNFISGGALANGNNAPNLVFQTSRGTAASPTTVLTGDVVASIVSAPFDGAQNQFNGSVDFVVDGLAGGVASAVVIKTGATSVAERLRVDSNGIASISNTSSASGLRVYNTVDSLSTAAPTNYERGIFDWTAVANTLYIGTQAGGTGTARNVVITSASNRIIFDGAGQQYTGYAADQNGTLARFGYGFTTGLVTSGTCNAAVNIIAAGVMSFGTNMGLGNNFGWYQWGGQVRSTADISVASSTVMTTSTSAVLSVPLQSGRNYSFEARIISTCSTTGGIALALQSTTITGSSDLRWHAYTLSNNTLAGEVFSTALGSSATLGGPVAVLPSTTNVAIYINGTITNTASSGNLQIWFAQDVSTSVASVVKKGSYMIVQDMP